MLSGMHVSRRILIIIALGILFAGAMYATVRVFSRGTFSPPEEKFTTEYGLTFTDYDGNQVHLYDYARTVLIVYAWASWCPYCASELQTLGQLKKSYGDSVEIVAINRGESAAVAKGFTGGISDSNGIVFLLDPTDAFFKAIGGYAMPEMVFIDSGGNVIYHQRGPIQVGDIRAKIQQLLQ